MSILAVIPARGGSKTIPRMNMRLMDGKPLLAYAIENALRSKLVDLVAVSSDSKEILAFASQYASVIAIERAPELSRDDITLDPVVYDAVCKVEAQCGKTFDAVVTMQPVSPLLSVETLDKALFEFTLMDCDTLVSVVNAPRLSWVTDERGVATPKYPLRSNRQYLPREYAERGAFLVTRRRSVSTDGMIGDAVRLFELSGREGLEVSNVEGWIACEAMLARKHIVFRVDGFRELGLGHVYRALTLAYEFVEHEVVFACDARHREGIDVLRRANMEVVEVRDDGEFLDWLSHTNPDILVNDKLDTELQYMREVRKYVGRLVSFEDLGPGAQEADAVINAIYEGASPFTNAYTGKRYVCLRDEFLTSIPATYSDKVGRVLVTFGGTDPLDLTGRLFKLAIQRNAETDSPVAFDFVLGPGYSRSFPEPPLDSLVEVHRDVARMSSLMRRADVALCSQGRTTFELASLGVPAIVLAQNEREQLHTFAQMDNGFINLGLGCEVSDEDIASTLEWLISAKSVRREMHRLMLDNDLKSGIRRVKRIVLGDEPY